MREEPENKQISAATMNGQSNQDQSQITDNNAGKSIFQKIIGILQLITIEPVVFFYAVGFSITMVVSPGLYMEKICSVSNISTICVLFVCLF